MSFVDGDLWERSFETANGVVDVLAEVVVDGRRVELRDLAVYPRGHPRLSVTVAEVARWLKAVAAEARQAGFDELRITGVRMSGATPGRRVDLTIRLEKDQP
jgi:hypothetical protein